MCWYGFAILKDCDETQRILFVFPRGFARKMVVFVKGNMPLQSERSSRLSLESCPCFDTVDVVLRGLRRRLVNPCARSLVAEQQPIRECATRIPIKLRRSKLRVRPLQWGRIELVKTSLFTRRNLTLFFPYFSQINLKVSRGKRKPRKTPMLPRGRCPLTCCG